MAVFIPISLFFIIFSFMLLLSPPCHSDPDPLQDFCVADLNSDATSVNGFLCKPASKVTSNDFFFDGLTIEGNTNNIFGSNVTSSNVLTFPALNTLGLSMNRVDFSPGGLNPPHWHPRSSELVFVAKGRLRVGFVTTRNVYFSKVLKAGEVFVIPRGLTHFQMNVGKGKAVAITTFNSQLPGAVVTPLNLFASQPSIPNEVLAKTFQVDDQIVKGIRKRFGS